MFTYLKPSYFKKQHFTVFVLTFIYRQYIGRVVLAEEYLQASPQYYMNKMAFCSGYVTCGGFKKKCGFFRKPELNWVSKNSKNLRRFFPTVFQ